MPKSAHKTKRNRPIRSALLKAIRAERVSPRVEAWLTIRDEPVVTPPEQKSSLGYFEALFQRYAPEVTKAKKPVKYIMRLPNKNPPPRWRYIYKVTHKDKHIGADEHLQEGAHMKIGGEDGDFHHAEIVERDGHKIKVKNTKTGEIEETTTQELRKKLHEHHAGDITRHRQGIKRMVAEIYKNGWQHSWGLARTHIDRAVRMGIVKDGGFEFEGEEAHEEWTPADASAITLHEEAMPDITTEVPEEVMKFSNPDGPKVGLFKHQGEAVARALQSFDERGGFLLQDETGLGKALTGLATIVANGGRRNLFIVPDSGKNALKTQLREEAELYNLSLKDWDGASADEEGIMLASYDEVYTTEVITGPDGRDMKVHKLRPEFETGFDCIVMDECQNVSNPDSVRAQANIDLQARSKNVMYMSATAMTNVRDMHYLRKLGLFSTGEEFVEFAQVIGATAKNPNKSDPVGDMPTDINNPDSPVPLVNVSAVLTHIGATVRRSPNLETGMNTVFSQSEHSKLTPELQKTFDTAEEIRQIAVDAGVPAFTAGGLMSMWHKQQWEVCKTEKAIELAKKAIDEGRQAALFYSFKKFDHAPLRSFAKMLLKEDAQKKMSLDPATARAAANKINKIVDGMPSFDPIDMAVKALEAHAGEGSVGQIHGGVRGDKASVQKKYQAGDHKIVIGTTAAMGTGLSFHDNKGIAPRTQINVALPYTAIDYQQVGGRSHRLGSQSETEMHWLVGDADTERRNGDLLAGRLQSLGAITSGDIGSIPTAEELSNWEFSSNQGLSIDEQLESIIAASGTEEPTSEQVKAGRDLFSSALAQLKAGGDALQAAGEAVRAARGVEADIDARKGVATLMSAGYRVTREGDNWILSHKDGNAGYSRKAAGSGAAAYLAIGSIRKKEGDRAKEAGDEPSYSAEHVKRPGPDGKPHQATLIRDPKVFEHLARTLSRKNQRDRDKGKTDETWFAPNAGSIGGWENHHLEAGHARLHKSRPFTQSLMKGKRDEFFKAPSPTPTFRELGLRFLHNIRD